MQGQEVIVAVIPAYKEELTIASVVVLAFQYADVVIVIDDGSPDRTSDIAEAVGAQVIRLAQNGGKAKALMAGLAAALELNPDCTVMIDGDGQMDPDEIPVVTAPILQGKADLVIGSRFLDKESSVPKHRRVGQEVLTAATNAGSTLKITDSQSGYRALSLLALQNMDFKSSHYAVESEMIVHFETRNLRIVEVPVGVRYDVPKGHKKSTATHGISVLEQIVSFIGFRRPLYVFGIPGLLLTCFGLLLGLATFLQTPLLFGWTLLVQGIAAVLFFGIGITMGLGGFILNALCRVIEDCGRQVSLSGNVKTSTSAVWKIKRFIDDVVRYLALRHPLLFFGLTGLVIGVAGLGFMFLALDSIIVLFRWSALTQGIFGLFMMVVGALLCTAGLILNSLSRLFTLDQ